MKKITLAGICSDHNSSYLRGPATAPAEIRQSLRCGSANLFSENGINFDDCLKKDLGDIIPGDSEDDFLAIEEWIAPAVSADDRLLILGGDHAVSYPVVRALTAVHGPLTILHFDAHPDLYDHYEGNRYAHACPFARIMEENLASRLVQVGIRTLNPHQREQAARFGVEMFQMNDFDIARFSPSLQSPLYISLDLDAIDPAFTPGVSHHEPGGLTTRDVLGIIQSVNCTVVGADIVEYNPVRDINNMTAMVAAKFVKELGAKLSER